MAERRMFAKTIIDSDAFLDMPLSTQALYFHLSMRADDEGFLNNPKKIQRMVGASEDDLKLLIAKKFLIPFDSGIVVIKHWRIHNYIRADRLTETKYQEEKKALELKDNGSYTLNKDLKAIESMDAKDIRKIAYEKSSLPYSFGYKIKRAFDGCKCPVCGVVMKSSDKLTMPTVQHNKPISKGGLHELDNISIICESCNTSIQDKETDSLNNLDVIEMWDRIVDAEKRKIKWFDNPNLLMTDKCLTSDGQVAGECHTQYRLGKDRLELGKDSIEIHTSTLDSENGISEAAADENIIPDNVQRDRINYKAIGDMYNTICISYPQCTVLSDRRKKSIKSCFKNGITEEDFEKAFRLSEDSTFMKGKNKTGWSANFDWIINPNNIVKILDGNYTQNTNTPRNDSKVLNSGSSDSLEDFYNMVDRWGNKAQ